MLREAHWVQGGILTVGQLGSKNDGPAVIGIPGWRGHDQGLVNVCAGLSDAGNMTYLLNLPGLGTSPSRESLTTFDQLIELTVEFINQLPENRSAILLGHSFGATVALACAWRQPDRVSKVVLLSPVVRAPFDRPGVRSRVLGWVGRWSLSALASSPNFCLGLFTRSRTLGVISNLILSRRGVRGRIKVLREARKEWQLHDDPKSVIKLTRMSLTVGCEQFATGTEPAVAIIAGDRDPFSSPQELHALSASLPNGQLTLIPGAGHLAHQEDDEVIASLVSELMTVDP